MSAVIVETWHRFDVRRIDDLSNAVFGADLEAIQMPGARVRGSLAFAMRDGIVFSSGLIAGNVMVSGPLSDDAMTLGIILQAGTGSRFWFNKVAEGNVGVILPRDECDLLCAGRALYVATTLTSSRLKQEAARQGLPVHRNLMSRTGLHTTSLEPGDLNWLKTEVAGIHSTKSTGTKKPRVGARLLAAIVNHYAQQPDAETERVLAAGRGQIVRDARKYIANNLREPISIEALADATSASRRSLFRAFSELLGDTPRDYVRRLRLHRIRRDLLSNAERTVSAAAHNWGIGQDLGRLSRDYRELFGENPSSTLAFGRALQQEDTWM